jgi:hypothetical protein
MRYQEEVFDVIATDENEPPPRVDVRHIDHGEPRAVALPAFAKCRRQADRAHAEPPGQIGEKPNQPEDEYKR